MPKVEIDQSQLGGAAKRADKQRRWSERTKLVVPLIRKDESELSGFGEELNRFLRGHRVLSVSRELVERDGAPGRAVCDMSESTSPRTQPRLGLVIHEFQVTRGSPARGATPGFGTDPLRG